MTIKCGRVARGILNGQHWEITRQEAGEPYRLDIGGEYYAGADSMRELLDEIEALDKLARGC